MGLTEYGDKVIDGSSEIRYSLLVLLKFELMHGYCLIKSWNEGYSSSIIEDLLYLLETEVSCFLRAEDYEPPNGLDSCQVVKGRGPSSVHDGVYIRGKSMSSERNLPSQSKIDCVNEVINGWRDLWFHLFSQPKHLWAFQFGVRVSLNVIVKINIFWRHELVREAVDNRCKKYSRVVNSFGLIYYVWNFVF